jgi:hypothetical protein
VVALPLLDALPALPVVLVRFPALRMTARARAVALCCREIFR